MRSLNQTLTFFVVKQGKPNMSKEHYWVCGRVDQYVNGFYRDDEPEKMTLMPARWETTVGLLNGECNDYVLHVD